MPKSDGSTLQDLQFALTEVARRSAVDLDFRALALRDAKAAIAKVSQAPLPADVEIKFIDNSGSVKTIVLPDPVAAGDLSELELENVAGGAPMTLGAGAQWTQG